MDDLISRQAAISAFSLSEKSRKYGGDHSGYDTMMLYEIQDVLEGLPSAYPERKKGKWEPESYYHNHEFICSECGNTGKWHWDYCPNCGADMRGEQDG